MLQNYFGIGAAIETRLREQFGDEVELICSPFTVNNPNDLKKYTVSLHLSPLPSVFGNYSGNGAKQAETQRWQVSLCYKSPSTAEEEQVMRDTVGDLLLRVRRCLQGFALFDVGGKSLRVVANQFYMTDDCRFRIFSFTVETECVI
ncbi:hypothetical protein QEO94_07320 [Kingella negevensis]|uniref:hypothetical protein n=1 Tax=Kingella negevensis TaxID=1522312 RepID=UPI002542EBA2|nr:hypothetical protein [Kingella negevensis]WII92454.1 hypothetical protein QEO94_07320 [Kingella negevensis]